MDEVLISDLRQLLRTDIERIHQPDGSEISRNAAYRLDLVAEYSPAFICLLAEPWLPPNITGQQRNLLTDCARIHLYARVLDDAILSANAGITGKPAPALPAGSPTPGPVPRP